MGRGQTDRHTDGHRDYQTELAQWADSVKSLVTKNVQSQNFLVPIFFQSNKNVCHKKFLVTKNFSHKKILVTKIFQSHFFFSYKNIYVTKKFQSQKNFSHTIFLVTKKFQSQKIFNHKKFLVTKKLQSQKKFSHKIFFQSLTHSLTHSLTLNNLKVTFSQRWTDQPTDRWTDGQTTYPRKNFKILAEGWATHTKSVSPKCVMLDWRAVTVTFYLAQ